MIACGYCNMFLTDEACELFDDLLPVQSIATLVKMSGSGLARCPEQGDQIVFEPERGYPGEMGYYDIGEEFYIACHCSDGDDPRRLPVTFS